MPKPKRKARPAARGRSDEVAVSLAETPPMRLRRWEAAETNRLNKTHWAKATGDPINLDLQADLENLRIRSLFEAENNPTVEGIIKTYCDDVIGKNGPRFNVVYEG